MWLFVREKLPGGAIPAEIIQEGRTQELIAVLDQLREGVFL